LKSEIARFCAGDAKIEHVIERFEQRFGVKWTR